jgi:hypothetical protein
MKEEQRDIQQELLKFIGGASKYRSNPLELTKTALYLLKSLPSARDAVLEFFNKMFDWSLERHIAQVSCNYMHCFFGGCSSVIVIVPQKSKISLSSGNLCLILR